MSAPIKRFMSLPLLLAGVMVSDLAQAHSGGSAGWMHPLSGLDHLLAMIAVGAWSCQMGGRAIWVVPSAFVCCMFLGGLLGFDQIDLPGSEIGVSLSVVLLGLAIGLRKTFAVPVAAFGVGVFGIFHGYAHGYEMPVMDDKIAYASGFLLTTASLHVIGAVGARQMLKMNAGARILRALRFICATCGLRLITNL